jgi:hypothetical protein
MEWTYKINATSGPRVLMRIAQVFDQQMVLIRACHLLDSGNKLSILITVDVGAELAQRIHAKLYKQLDLEQIDLVAGRLPHLQDDEVKRPAIYEIPSMDEEVRTREAE